MNYLHTKLSSFSVVSIRVGDLCYLLTITRDIVRSQGGNEIKGTSVYDKFISNDLSRSYEDQGNGTLAIHESVYELNPQNLQTY